MLDQKMIFDKPGGGVWKHIEKLITTDADYILVTFTEKLR